MPNWAALIEAPIGVFLLYVAIAMIVPIQVPLFGQLENTTAIPHGATIKILVMLIPLLLAVMLLYSAYKSFREPDMPQYLVPR